MSDDSAITEKNLVETKSSWVDVDGVSFRTRAPRMPVRLGAIQHLRRNPYDSSDLRWRDRHVRRGLHREAVGDEDLASSDVFELKDFRELERSVPRRV